VYAIIVMMTRDGFGRHTVYIHPENIMSVFHQLWVMQFFFISAVSCVKISVTLMLLRIRDDRIWRIGLYLLMAFIVAAAGVNVILECIQCKPIRAFWDRATPGAQCWGPEKVQVSLYIASCKPRCHPSSSSAAYRTIAIFLAADVILSLLPLTFIFKLARPLREKIILAGLMGLGLFASGAAVVKILLVKKYVSGPDPLWDMFDLGIWAMVELFAGIYAASIPCLRAPFEAFLRKVGVLTVREKTYGSSRSNYKDASGMDTEGSVGGEGKAGESWYEYPPDIQRSVPPNHSDFYETSDNAGRDIWMKREFEVK
jgi:hypothetical protein